MFSIAIFAKLALFEPSKVNGIVKTPIVGILFFRQISEINGVAPDPVPPPKPAVINSKSVSNNNSCICFLLS